MKTSEPAMAYGNVSQLQNLKESLIASIENMDDECTLQACWELLHYNGAMPCRYTEEELREVINRAEEEGFASKKEVDDMFARWLH